MTSQEGTPQQRGTTTLLATKASFWSRVYHYLKVQVLQFFVTNIFRISELPLFRNALIQPTLKKVYPVHKTLVNRVYIPRSYKSGDALLPLYINIHGGGFVIGNPCQDDKFCSNFANDNKWLVVSLQYPLAPADPFPNAVHALTDLVKVVLDDETLPFNKKKVAIGGFSAGANLALAVVQDNGLQGKIGGVMSFYGAMDFTETTATKMKTRPPWAGRDPLESVGPMFNWAYVNPGTNLRDPLLSVKFAPQEKLPPKIYFIGCELDFLCRDSEILAERLVKERTGKNVKPGDLWENGGIKWEKIMNEEHGFEATPAFGQKKIRVEKRGAEMFKSASEFLLREVYG